MMDSDIVIQIMISLAFIMSAVSLKLSVDSSKRNNNLGVNLKLDRLEVEDELIVRGTISTAKGINVYDSRLTNKEEKDNEQNS